MNRPILRLVLPLVLVLAAGGGFTRWLVQRADQEMRADLIQQAQLLAQGLNVEQIALLAGSAPNSNDPNYRRIKEQLTLVRSTYPLCRFIYITARKPDGSIVFVVDSEPEGSPAISPPGQVYSEASGQFRDVFDHKISIAEGPLPDRWGVWTSALVPIVDAQMGTLVGVLGMDIDARDWNWNLVRAALPPALLALALAAILLVGGLLLNRRARTDGAPAGWMRHLEVGLVVAVGLILSLTAAWLADTNVSRRRNDSFAKLAGSQTAAMVEKLQGIRDNQLESLAHFYAARDQISAGEFEEFTQSLTRNLTVTIWGWAPVVTAAERDQFETMVRASGLAGFEIWEFDSSGKRVRASGRDVYYPVFQVAPSKGNEAFIGRDSASEPLRRAALQEAIRTHLATATDPVVVPSVMGNQKGIIAYRPVFARDNPDRLRGFVGAVVRLETLLQTSAFLDRMPLMELSLLHKGAAPETLATTWSGTRPPAIGRPATRPLFVFGKVLIVTTHPGPEFARDNPLRAGALSLMFGLVLTGTVATITRLTLRQRARLERLVGERTTELRQSEESYRNQFANNSTAMLLLDPADGSIIDANAAAVGYYGYSLESLRAMRTDDLTLRASDEVKELIAAIAAGQRTRFESRHRLADGKVRDVAVASSSIQYGGRTVLHVIIQDITEQKQAQEALQERLKEMRCLYSISKLTAESDRPVADLLAAAVELIPPAWQYSAQARARITFRGQVFATPGFQANAWMQSADIVIAGETTGTVEVCYLGAIPSRTGSPFLPEEQTLLANIALQFGAMIERRQAEENLRRLSGVIEQAPLSVIIINLERVIDYVNPRFCAVTGYTKEEVVGQPVGVIGTQELQPETYAELSQTVRIKKVWTGELRSRRKNGELFLEHVVVAPLVDDQGRITHFVSLKDDITAQKRSEAELAKERELSGLKSQFISVASHEFRTPLAAAVGSLELLERHAAKLTEAKRVELLGRIQRSLARLTAIMDDVLQLSRADSGRVKVNRMTVDLVQFVQDIVQEVSTGDRQQHHFVFEQTGGPGVVPVDTKLVHHIISNLVGNAARYSPAGTKVSVRLDLGAEEFALTVADEGIGVPEAEKDRIFEPFVRGSNVGQIGGTGLGLNIVKRYTELMDGRIELLPTDRGATFRVHIPCPPNLPPPA